MNTLDTDRGYYCAFCHPNGFDRNTVTIDPESASLQMTTPTLFSDNNEAPNAQRFKYCPLCGRHMEELSLRDVYAALEEMKDSMVLDRRMRHAVEGAMRWIRRTANLSKTAPQST